MNEASHGNPLVLDYTPCRTISFQRWLLLSKKHKICVWLL